jgi:hypothetical protein
MKKLIILVSSLLLLLTGCVGKNNSGDNSVDPGSNNNNGTQNPKMIGTVKQINYTDEKVKSILIIDEKNSLFVFSIDEKVEFKEVQSLKTGNKVEIEHTGEIRESYPAQGTALKIIILDHKTAETVDSSLYSVLPINAQYNEELYQKGISTPLGVITDIIDDKAEFDKYMTELNFVSDFKINLKGKYDEEFFKALNLVFIAMFTSSTPAYDVKELTKNNETFNVVIEEKTSEMQTDDIAIKGFLVEVPSSLLDDNAVIDIEYLRKVSTK